MRKIIKVSITPGAGVYGELSENENSANTFLPPNLRGIKFAAKSRVKFDFPASGNLIYTTAAVDKRVRQNSRRKSRSRGGGAGWVGII